ncbi:MAG: OmpA family protein [Woeseiaceae bacterium]|nr:OmpA family protein [Woeseiaceae bacterium]
MVNWNNAKGLVALAVLAVLAAGPASAETRSSREEAAGVGIGGTVGALAGGPVGFIVGAAAGGWLGDNFSKKKQAVAELTGSLDDAESRVAGLEVEMHRIGDERLKTEEELTRLRSLARPELLSLLQTGIEMDLLFRTDEHELADTTSGRLTQLATTLAGMPDVYIQLDGFADERGDAAYNQDLSIRRADHVRSVLTAAGVTPSRIKVAAHGESPAIDSSIDSYALDRRVSLTLYVEDNASFASNPD